MGRTQVAKWNSVCQFSNHQEPFKSTNNFLSLSHPSPFHQQHQLMPMPIQSYTHAKPLDVSRTKWLAVCIAQSPVKWNCWRRKTFTSTWPHWLLYCDWPNTWISSMKKCMPVNHSSQSPHQVAPIAAKPKSDGHTTEMDFVVDTRLSFRNSAKSTK